MSPSTFSYRLVVVCMRLWPCSFAHTPTTVRHQFGQRIPSPHPILLCYTKLQRPSFTRASLGWFPWSLVPSLSLSLCFSLSVLGLSPTTPHASSCTIVNPVVSVSPVLPQLCNSHIARLRIFSRGILCFLIHFSIPASHSSSFLPNHPLTSTRSRTD